MLVSAKETRFPQLWTRGAGNYLNSVCKLGSNELYNHLNIKRPIIEHPNFLDEVI